MEYLQTLLGSHEWLQIVLENNYVVVLPDLFWVVKAILLIVCVVYTMKGLFSLLRVY